MPLSVEELGGTVKNDQKVTNLTSFTPLSGRFYATF